MTRWRRFKFAVRQRIGIGPVGLSFAALMAWFGVWFLAGAIIQVARYVAS